MNCIKLLKLNQSGLIINDLLNTSGIQSEEIYHNMWCISLGDDLAKNIKVNQLHDFVEKLIDNRKQQLRKMNCKKNVVFYIWFDEQALQLSFNIITGSAKSLPFGCKLNFVNCLDVILSNFICFVHDFNEFGDEIEFFDKNDDHFYDDDDDDIEEYVLDVFVQQLSIEYIEA